jgi:Na+/alanine symporter
LGVPIVLATAVMLGLLGVWLWPASLLGVLAGLVSYAAGAGQASQARSSRLHPLTTACVVALAVATVVATALIILTSPLGGSTTELERNGELIESVTVPPGG